MTLPAIVDTPVPITMFLEDGATNQYPQAEIYAAGGTTPLTVLDLLHKANGRYEENWTPTSAGVYSSHFTVYADAGHTIENILYVQGVEQIAVSDGSIEDLTMMVIRILGLTHENVFIDNTVHAVTGQLISSRVRLFDSRTNVEAATDGGTETTGLISTYLMDSVYNPSSGYMDSYRMKKVT